MKKAISLIAALILMISKVPAAQAEKTSFSRVEGLITQIQEDGSFLLDSITQGIILVHVNIETVFDGQKALDVGQYVIVEFSGAITRSLPPQLTAQRIGCYVINGTVQSLDETAGTALIDSKNFGLVLVHLPAMETVLKSGDFVAVYFSGVMALSYPGQAGGLKVDIYEKIQGEVTEINKKYLLLEGYTGVIRVNVGDTTVKPEELKTGEKVSVYYLGDMTKSLPPQVFGNIIERADDAK